MQDACWDTFRKGGRKEGRKEGRALTASSKRKRGKEEKVASPPLSSLSHFPSLASPIEQMIQSFLPKRRHLPLRRRSLRGPHFRCGTGGGGTWKIVGHQSQRNIIPLAPHERNFVRLMPLYAREYMCCVPCVRPCHARPLRSRSLHHVFAYATAPSRGRAADPLQTCFFSPAISPPSPSLSLSDLNVLFSTFSSN